MLKHSKAMASLKRCAPASGHIAADIALVGIGVLPNVELAPDAGLACDDGIVVDALRTTEIPQYSPPAIARAMSVAMAPDPAGVGAERHRPGQTCSVRDAGPADALSRGPLVLVGSV